MLDSLAIGIIMPNNLRSGMRKHHTITALDLASHGHYVTLFIPLFPWYYYFVTLRRHPLMWLRYVLPHAKNWLRDRNFSFQELLANEEIRSRISVKFVLRHASKNQMAGLDCLILNTIEQIVGYRGRFPEERQVYLLHHPEEQVHGHADEIQNIRRSFRGKTLVISPFTAREVSDHVTSPTVVPNPISPVLWEQRNSVEMGVARRDILLSWKDNESGREAATILKALREVRPNTSLTVWCVGLGARAGALEALPGERIVENISEVELRDLYLGHSLLLFPSNYEGFGMPPIEALSCGCIPVLHPDVGAAELYARDGENSIFLDEPPRSVAQRLAELLDNPEALRSLRRVAPESIASFAPDGYGVRLLQASGFL